MRESLPVKEKIRRLLSVGRDYLGTDHGYMTRTDVSNMLDADLNVESSEETGTVVRIRFAPVSTASTVGYLG